ncbi:hypothetical protein BC940DRAFT_307674 [Gongronella butleri]|nr:hypothetical protein BC940DRAFT_307674 [Gongronella butleri]
MSRKMMRACMDPPASSFMYNFKSDTTPAHRHLLEFWNSRFSRVSSTLIALLRLFLGNKQSLTRINFAVVVIGKHVPIASHRLRM